MKYTATALRGIAPLLFGLLSLSLLCCTTDAYDKGEGDYSLMVAEMADIQVNHDKQAVSAVTDEGQRLLFAQPFTINWFTTADSVYRAVLYYNKVATDGGAEENGYAVEPIGVNRVSVLLPHRIDSMKCDPVRLESMWLSTTKRYLNAGIYVMVGSSGDDDLKQVLGLGVDTLVVNDDGRSRLDLTLYHDQGGMPEYYSQRAYVSVPLDSLNVDTVSLRINTYEGTVQKKFGLR